MGIRFSVTQVPLIRLLSDARVQITETLDSNDCCAWADHVRCYQCCLCARCHQNKCTACNGFSGRITDRNFNTVHQLLLHLLHRATAAVEQAELLQSGKLCQKAAHPRLCLCAAPNHRQNFRIRICQIFCLYNAVPAGRPHGGDCGGSHQCHRRAGVDVAEDHQVSMTERIPRQRCAVSVDPFHTCIMTVV